MFSLVSKQENADQRLTQLGYEAGAVSERRWEHFQQRRERVSRAFKVCGVWCVVRGVLGAHALSWTSVT